eukprot:6476622-Amphidinium_carterae.1
MVKAEIDRVKDVDGNSQFVYVKDFGEVQLEHSCRQEHCAHCSATAPEFSFVVGSFTFNRTSTRSTAAECTLFEVSPLRQLRGRCSDCWA